ncbi:MAG: proline racemase family protein [Flavobacteriaceae bacterium]|nr:proline racemase family protein [Flavobacteriaceae bacterium]
MKTTYLNSLKNTTFTPPSDWIQIKTIDMHTGGEPLRVILEGFPALKGNSVLEYRKYCKENFDNLRTSLLLEPRGHPDMYGCIITPPNDNKGDFGVIFLHNQGYSTMCGHAIIAISTLAITLNWITVKEGENILKIDAPCGRITSYTTVKNGEVTGVKFHCVPSFVIGLDRKISLPGIGEVTYDLAFGGAFYAYVDLQKNNFEFDLSLENYQTLIKTGMDIKRAVIKKDHEILHPFEDEMSELYGTIFIDASKNPKIASRNVCVFANGEVDRCPTGSGVSGRMAIHKKRKEIGFNQTMTIESITDSVFVASVISEEQYGPYTAVIPQVAGSAHITGSNTFIIDPKDPIKNGFILR